jgi:outer membrane protein OmpA-like peptidoglycan-associated protein
MRDELAKAMAAPHMSDRHADDAERPSGSGSHDDEKALQELRSLLLSEEQHEIVALRERIESPEQRALDVSAVVAEAIELRRAQGGDQKLSAALTPTVEQAVRESVRKDSQVLVEALFPVMGPAIRRSVAEVLRSTVESFNQVLESTFSIRGLQWRLEAMRIGRPYAEVALLHSLVYRVEQVFLIHQRTSLMLQHVVDPAVATQDADMVSSMLSAIRDFVRDSFETQQSDSLDRVQMGQLQIWIEQGPQAILAAVIRGQAPQELRLTLKEKLEEAHRRFSRELEKFDGNAAPFEAFRPELTACLTASYRRDARAKSRPYVAVAAIALAVLLAGWLGYATYQNRKWAGFVGELREQPGIVVTSFTKSGGRYQLQGLRDPLAADPWAILQQRGLDPGKAAFRWSAFYALDDAIVQQRATALLSPPPGVRLTVRGGVLHAVGNCTSAWESVLHERGPLIAGISAVDDSRLNSLGSTAILFDLAQAEISPRQSENLASAAQEIQKILRTLPNGASFELVGHADSTGAEATNERLSQERADNVMRALIRLGVPAASLRATGVGMSAPLRPETDEQNRQFNRSVTIQVLGAQVPPKQ